MMNRSRQFNLKPDSHFESLIAQTAGRRQSLSAKRKVSELIIQELEEESVAQKQQTNKPKSKISRKDSEFDIQDSFYGENRPPKLSSTSIFAQSASSTAKRTGPLRIQSLFEDEEELTSSSINKPKPDLLNIDEIDDDEDSRSSLISDSVFAYKPKSQKPGGTRLNLDQLLNSQGLQHSVIQDVRIDEMKDDSISRQIMTKRKSNEANKKKNIEPDVLISDDEENTRQWSPPIRRSSRLANNKQTPVKLLEQLFSQSSELRDDPKSSVEIDENIEQADETIVTAGDDTGNKKGTEWLREVNDKLNQTGYLTGANSNETDTTTGGKRTSPTLLTVNTSSLFLNSVDLKRRKVKYVKNGLAERLQKLLIRQASSINFIKHHMNKRGGSPSGKNQVIKNLPNVIRAVPFHKQSFYNGHFYLIHALDADKLETTTRTVDGSSTFMILIDSRSIDSKYLNLAGDNSASEARKHLLVMNIYPPWKKIHLGESKSDVYFNINLIEVENLTSTKSSINYQPHILFDFHINQSSSKSLLFRVNDLIASMKRVNEKAISSVANSHLLFTQTQRASNLITVSTEDQYMQQISNTQYMNVNSILDALENVGYYGFVTFKATVQRIGLNKSPTLFNQASLTSSFQTQASAGGSSQENQYRHHVIVSDKCGMFALITFPLSFDFSLVIESHKYQFNSLKFLEKQVLSPRENPFLHDQINYLWIEMNEMLKAKSRPTLKSYQKNIFIFEYMSSNRSWLDSFGSSNNYISLPAFSSFNDVTNHIQKNKLKKFIFNLNNLILLKLVDLGQFNYATQTPTSESKSYMIFFVDKRSLFSSDNQTPSIYSIGLQTLAQINSSQLLINLHKNNIEVDEKHFSEEKIVCLKNLQLEETESLDFELDSNLYTSFDLIESRSLTDLGYNLECQEASFFENQKAISISKLFNEASKELKEFEFVQFSGQVINTVLEDCIIRGSCCSERIASTKDLICSECKSPMVQLDLTVVLNCVGIGRHARVRLHRDTVNKIVPLDVQLSTYRNKERFDFTFMTKKPISPLLCFVSQINDFEILAEELSIVQRAS